MGSTVSYTTKFLDHYVFFKKVLFNLIQHGCIKLIHWSKVTAKAFVFQQKIQINFNSSKLSAFFFLSWAASEITSIPAIKPKQRWEHYVWIHSIYKSVGKKKMTWWFWSLHMPYDGHFTIPWGSQERFANEVTKLTLVGHMTVTTWRM